MGLFKQKKVNRILLSEENDKAPVPVCYFCVPLEHESCQIYQGLQSRKSQQGDHKYLGEKSKKHQIIGKYMFSNFKHVFPVCFCWEQ